MEIKNLEIIGGYKYVRKQVEKHLSMLHDLSSSEKDYIDECLPAALTKVRDCWSEISNKYYNRGSQPTFDINNSNQYAQFLLIFARALNVQGYSLFADKVFGLNKALNSCDIYHEVILPRSFYIDHTLGIVIGRAKLGERLFLSQSCIIGSNPGQPDYPVLGVDNYLMSNVTLVGNVKTGDRVIFAVGSMVKDMDIPSDSIVFGRTPDNVIKPLKPETFTKSSPFII